MARSATRRGARTRWSACRLAPSSTPRSTRRCGSRGYGSGLSCGRVEPSPASPVVTARSTSPSRARANVRGPARVTARAYDVERAARELADGGERFDMVLLDPPRAGAVGIASLLPRLAPKVVYVSCDPMTLARDATTLAGHGLPPT